MGQAITWLLCAVAALSVPARAFHWSGSVCTQDPYSYILPLSGYPPAESFCASAYPLKPVTHTVTTTPASITSTTTTSVTLTTTTITSTVDVPAQKKRDNPAKASQWHDCSSRLRHAGGGFLSTACSCIQTPSTTTVTKTAPPRIDSTSISTVDSTSIITTVDATTTVCTAGTIANPSGPGYFSTACGTSVIPIFTPTPDSATSFDSCLASCAGRTEVSTGACCAVDFDVSTGVCNLQITMSDSSTCTYGYTYTPDPAYDYAIYYNPS